MNASEYKYARLFLGLSRKSLARECGDKVETVAKREQGLIEVEESAVWDIYRLLKSPPPRDVRTPAGAAAIRREAGL